MASRSSEVNFTKNYYTHLPFLPLTMAVSVAVCEIFSVKEWCDLENRVRVRSRSLEMAPFDRSHAYEFLFAFHSNYSFIHSFIETVKTVDKTQLKYIYKCIHIYVYSVNKGLQRAVLWQSFYHQSWLLNNACDNAETDDLWRQEEVVSVHDVHCITFSWRGCRHCQQWAASGLGRLRDIATYW